MTTTSPGRNVGTSDSLRYVWNNSPSIGQAIVAADAIPPSRIAATAVMTFQCPFGA